MAVAHRALSRRQMGRSRRLGALQSRSPRQAHFRNVRCAHATRPDRVYEAREPRSRAIDGSSRCGTLIVQRNRHPFSSSRRRSTPPMSWLLSLVIAVLDALLGCFAAGLVASLCVDWYRITSREGASGYFVIAVGFLGGIAGFLIGFVVSRIVAAGAEPGFLKGLGISAGLIVAIALIATLIAWLFADIPPRLDGQLLNLAVEIRLPVGETQSPAAATGESFLTLGSINPWTHVQRAYELGKLYLADARLVDG